MAAREHVRIFDTTLRDGEQSPGCSMTAPEKVRLAQELDRLGVDVIEAGFPIASDGDFQAVQTVACEVRRPVIAALARCCRDDIERAWQALAGAAHPRVHTFLATSDIHLQHKLKISRRECIEQARDAVKLAKSYCRDVEFSAEDATRSDRDFLCEVLEAVVEAGASTINIPDTVGYSVPGEITELIHAVRQRVRGIEQARDSARPEFSHQTLGTYPEKRFDHCGARVDSPRLGFDRADDPRFFLAGNRTSRYRLAERLPAGRRFRAPLHASI